MLHNEPCRVNSELNAFLASEKSLDDNATRITKLAMDQLARVEQLAREISNGFSFTDVRNIDGESVSLTFSMRNVADFISEQITPEICTGLMRGEPTTLFEIQKMIGDAALHVAFEALNLASNPFLDYDDLESEANGDF